MLSEWVDRLRSAMDEEFGQRPRVVTLATVLRRRHARARSVVCRRIDEEGRLYFVSDGRSAKNAQLRLNGSAEVVCWLPTRKEQYRITGSVYIADAAGGGPIRQATWRQLNDATRATFFWPAPGTPRTSDGGAFPRGVDASTAAPPSFEVLVLSPGEVEFLDLKPHPHDRRRWTAVGGWPEYRLNP